MAIVIMSSKFVTIVVKTAINEWFIKKVVTELIVCIWVISIAALEKGKASNAVFLNKFSLEDQGLV